MFSRLLVGRLLLLLGIIGGFVSFWYTIDNTWNPEFQSVNLPDAPTHSNYHAFRGAMLALGVNFLLIWVALTKKVTKEAWGIVTFMAVFYYLGWWAAWPIWGLHAPDVAAEMNHVLGTLGGLSGLLVLRPRGAA